MSTELSASAFSASAGMLSSPITLLFLSYIMAFLICSLLGAPQSISTTFSAGKIFGGLGSTGLFYSSSMCSTYLFLCFSSPTICHPDLLLTGLSCLLHFPDSFLLVSCKSFVCPAFTTCSASSDNLSMYCLLLALILCLVLLFTSEYASCERQEILISVATCAVFLASYIVLTFHVPKFKVMRPRRVLNFATSRLFQLSPHCVVHLLVEMTSLAGSEMSRCIPVGISVAFVFYVVGLLTLRTTPWTQRASGFLSVFLPLVTGSSYLKAPETCLSPLSICC